MKKKILTYKLLLFCTGINIYNTINVNILRPFTKWYCKPPTHMEIIEIVRKYNDKLSVGLDEISEFIFKRYIHLITPPMTSTFNKWLSIGIFSSDLKSSRIKPTGVIKWASGTLSQFPWHQNFLKYLNILYSNDIFSL